MKKIRLWYITANEFSHINRSIKVMAEYDWIDSIVILHTDSNEPKYGGKLAEISPKKIKEYWTDFGNGFDKSIEDGGFDEIGARNMALYLCKQDGFKGWVLYCDSDEYYTYDTIKAFQMAEQGNYDSINFRCFHLNDKLTYRVNPRNIYDRHVRAWILNDDIKFAPHDSEEFMRQFKNKTLHCRRIGCKKTLTTDLKYHIHTKFLYKDKYKPLPQDFAIYPIEFELPEIYINESDI